MKQYICVVPEEDQKPLGGFYYDSAHGAERSLKFFAEDRTPLAACPHCGKPPYERPPNPWKRAYVREVEVSFS